MLSIISGILFCNDFHRRKQNLIVLFRDKNRLLERRVTDYEEVSALPGYHRSAAMWNGSSTDEETKLALLQTQVAACDESDEKSECMKSFFNSLAAEFFFLHSN